MSWYDHLTCHLFNHLSIDIHLLPPVCSYKASFSVFFPSSTHTLLYLSPQSFFLSSIQTFPITLVQNFQISQSFYLSSSLHRHFRSPVFCFFLNFMLTVFKEIDGLVAFCSVGPLNLAPIFVQYIFLYIFIYPASLAPFNQHTFPYYLSFSLTVPNTLLLSLLCLFNH